MKTLTDSQIQDFKENGYLLVEDALSPDDLNPLIAEFDEIVNSGASRLYEEGEIDSEFKTEGFDTRLAKITEQSPIVFKSCLVARTRDRHSLIFWLIRNYLTSLNRLSDQR